MKGLEITVLNSNFSKVDNVDFRLDAEYFSKEYISLLKTINSKGYKEISEIAYVTDGIHTSIDYSEDSCINLISATSPRENYFDLNRKAYISEKSHNENKRTALKVNDIILSTVGTIGNCAVVTKSILPANSDRHVGIIRNVKDFSPFYISTFLLCKYGRFQTLRESTGNVQLNLFLYKIRNLKIVSLTNSFQKSIENLIIKANNYLEKSECNYKSTENEVAKCLGLQNWQPTEENTTVKKFSESFGNSGRLDAEFYQPYFDEVETILKSKGFALLEDICSEINYGTVPTSPYTEDGTGIPYIKGTNFKNTLIDSEGLDRIVNTDDLPEKYFTKEGDIIISQMGTVGDTGVVEKHQVGWLFASFTIRVRIKDKKNFDPHFVAFYIQHIAKPYYLHRYIAQASVRQNTDLPTIKNLYVPKVPIETQKEIAKQIKKSFKLKQDSSHLIEIAKQAVEIAIEKDEATALNFIKEKEAEIN